MTVIGFHCSHEQISPAQLSAGRPAGRTGRLHRRDVLGPLQPVERAAGRVRLRLVLPRRCAGHDEPPVRRRQRARAALPPGDHRPGHRDARADVPGSVLGGARIGRGIQRAGHRRGLAAQGGARPAPRRMRRRHPAAARRRGGQPRRARHVNRAGCGRCPTPSPTSSARPSPPRPPRATPRGRTASITVNQPTGDAAEGPGLVSRGRRPRPGTPADPPQLGADRRRGRSPSPTTSGAATSSARRSCWDLETVEAFDVISEDVTPEQVDAVGATSRATSAGTPRGCRSTSTKDGTSCTCTSSARSRPAFIDAFGEHVLPQLSPTAPRRRATIA